MKSIRYSLVALVTFSFVYASSIASSAGEQLVPVIFDDKPVPLHHHLFGAPQKFAIHSPHGDPIRFELRIPEHSTNPVEVTLSDVAGSTVSASAYETGDHEVEILVPTAGTYFLDINNERTMWRIVVPENTSAVLCLEAGKPINYSGGMLKRYFYVPRGTEELRFTAESGHTTYKLEVLDPDGNVVRTFTESEPVAPVPIPSGMDGQVWSFDAVHFAPTFLSFENIPNYLATSPNALLLPKEVVEKDGL